MKVNFLQISNVLSFKYHQDINSTPKIQFKPDLNILIGQNGSGKSTALEVLNFIFKKVLFIKYESDIIGWETQSVLSFPARKNMIRNSSVLTFGEFRLEPNWSTENEQQKIKIQVILDHIDMENLIFLKTNQSKLTDIASKFSNEPEFDFQYLKSTFDLNIMLDRVNNTFDVDSSDIADPGLVYLIRYNYFNELINFYNLENPASQLKPLSESFTFISSFRNYNAFNNAVSLQQLSSVQIRDIKNSLFIKSLNDNDQSEPPIFNLVRLRVADIHYELLSQSFDNEECERKASEVPFLLLINRKLSLINLEVRIKLLHKRTWEYSFSFFDIKRNRLLDSINSLSAGQKSIVHLVFEAYGRGDVKGGLVIIDEPEIHLHHQFQDEYLRIIEEINAEQKCQYILVTHSESFINSKTINSIFRFSLDANNNSVFHAPVVYGDQNVLVKILDNTRSAFAFFATKVVFVEGDTDRYFFRAAFNLKKPHLNQAVAIIQINGKGNFPKWKDFFEDFGLNVYYIGDFDNVFNLKFGSATLIDKTDVVRFQTELKQQKLDNLSLEQTDRLTDFHTILTQETDFLTSPKMGPWNKLIDKYNELERIDRQHLVAKTKANYTNLEADIESKYPQGIFILKKGAIETYTGTPHAHMQQIVDFCGNHFETWLDSGTPEALEIMNIISLISA